MTDELQTVTWMPLSTSWRVTGLVSAGGRRRRGLDITLTVETQAKVVVDAIEAAAANAGIQLERLE